MNGTAPVSRSPFPDSRHFHPGRDLPRLEQFAYEMLCAASRPPAASIRLRAAALEPARLARVADSSASPGIPLGYELWLDYLFELEGMHRQIAFSPRALTAVELAGLQALNRARARFLREHTFCPHCEAANRRPARMCAHCHKEL